MKIALVAGHDSYKKQGAYAYGVSENLFWNKFIRKVLPSLPIVHDYSIFYRPNQLHLGYHKAVSELYSNIQAWGADLSIEFHFNMSSSSQARGHEVLYTNKSHLSKTYANIFNDALTLHLTSRNRGAKRLTLSDRGGYQLSITDNPSILIEAFFGVPELPYYTSGEGYDRLKNAVIDFLTQIN